MDAVRSVSTFVDIGDTHKQGDRQAVLHSLTGLLTPQLFLMGLRTGHREPISVCDAAFKIEPLSRRRFCCSTGLGENMVSTPPQRDPERALLGPKRNLERAWGPISGFLQRYQYVTAKRLNYHPHKNKG